MAPRCHVDRVSEISDEVTAAIGQLVGQLSSTARTPTRAELQRVADGPATRLLLARDGDGTVLGMLTLAVFHTPTGTRAIIEDVVVDVAARRRGVAEALTGEALRIAAADGVRTVDLSCRPSRTAANQLYRKLGFVARDTNVYRFVPQA